MIITVADQDKNLCRYARYAETPPYASGWQTFSYGKLGELTENIRTFALPNEVYPYTFKMGFLYDSWNRIQSMTYPDGEVVSYDYNRGGMLETVRGNKNGVTCKYIEEIRYNLFEQKDAVIYGNGTKTYYKYDSLLRLAQLHSISADGVMQDIYYSFDKVGNITHLQNASAVLSSGLGGPYECHFTYDNNYRLMSANGRWDGVSPLDYHVDMAYHKNGRISEKTIEISDVATGTVQSQYTYLYHYPSNSNKLALISYGSEQFFQWDATGNMVFHHKHYHEEDFSRNLCWDEQNRLQGVVDENYLSYYQYDANGDRTYKLTGKGDLQNISGSWRYFYLLDNATLYASPYLVATDKGYTKHYYAEDVRIASKIGGGGLGEIDYLFLSKDTFFKKIKANGKMLNEVIHECLGVDYYDVKSALKKLYLWQDSIQAEDDCYWYHPDHLGSSSWITYTDSSAVQHLYYLPWGEDFVDQKSSGFDGVRFTFSAKERDLETGLSYFGSRYYSSDLSIWLSVDPMSDKYPSLSPYTYCADNPVKLVDPNGEEISTHTDKNGNVLAVYNDGQLGIYVHTQAEIDAFRKGVKFQNDVNQLKGHTLCVSSFSVGDKIDFESFQANRWFNTFKGMFSFAFASPMNAVAYYASEAGNGGLFDPKSKFKNGSQLTEGIYVSPRDLGNYAAGYFGHAVGLSKEFTLASFGAFQLSKNNKVEFLAHFNKYYRQALSTIGIGIEPFQKTYGEAAISNYFQRLGYENINTLDDFNKKYSMIWKD